MSDLSDLTGDLRTRLRDPIERMRPRMAVLLSDVLWTDHRLTSAVSSIPRFAKREEREVLVRQIKDVASLKGHETLKPRGSAIEGFFPRMRRPASERTILTSLHAHTTERPPSVQVACGNITLHCCTRSDMSLPDFSGAASAVPSSRTQVVRKDERKKLCGVGAHST